MTLYDSMYKMGVCRWFMGQDVSQRKNSQVKTNKEKH